MVKMEIEWADPPESAIVGKGRKGKYEEFALALAARPRAWAKWPNVHREHSIASNTATNIRNGKMKGFPKGAYEAVVDDVTIYVRYVGLESSKGKPTPPSYQRRQPTPAQMAFNKRVREWAREQGIEVAERGRISDEVLEGFRAARPRSAGATE